MHVWMDGRMMDEWWCVMDDGWWMMHDGWWVIDDGWWMMGDRWWMMGDRWWMMDDGWWVIDDGWWMMDNGWLSTFIRALPVGRNSGRSWGGEQFARPSEVLHVLTPMRGEDHFCVSFRSSVFGGIISAMLVNAGHGVCIVFQIVLGLIWDRWVLFVIISAQFCNCFGIISGPFWDSLEIYMECLRIFCFYLCVLGSPKIPN